MTDRLCKNPLMAPPKTCIITRVFTEEDEKALLKAMVTYKLDKGHDAVSNLLAFKDFVNPFLSFTASKNQVADKIRRLRKKFFNILKRVQNGENPYFSRVHEDRLFKLSKKVWGKENRQVYGDSDSMKSGDENQGRNQSVPDENDSVGSSSRKGRVEDCWALYPFLCASIESEAKKYFSLQRYCLKEYVKKVISGIEREKARELEGEWEGYFRMEQQFYGKRTEMIRKQSEAKSMLKF